MLALNRRAGFVHNLSHRAPCVNTRRRHVTSEELLMFAYNVSNAKVAAAGELLWLVTLDDEVLVQTPGTRTPNHAALAKQLKGAEWAKAKIMAGEPLGFGGTIADGKITYSGLMGSEGSVPKAYDPHGSIVGGNRVREAVEKVYIQAEQMGIPVDPSYSLNAVVPGQGLVPHERGLIGKIATSGSFYNEVLGKDVDFLDDGILEDFRHSTQAWSVYDKDTGDYYEIREDGTVYDAETGEHVGSFDAFVDPTSREPDDDRDLDWYPDWHGAKKEAISWDFRAPKVPADEEMLRAFAADVQGLLGEADSGFVYQRVLEITKGDIPWNTTPWHWNRAVKRVAEQVGSFDQPRGPRVDDGPAGDMPFGSPSSPRRMTNMQKGAPYPGHHDEDKSHDKEHIKGAPEKVNEIYHACMRDGEGDKEKCAKIAWSTYKKMKKKKSEVEKTAGTFEYLAAPMGIHGRTGEVMGALGLSATVTLPPNGDYPEGLVAQIPGQAMDIAWWGLDYEDWEAEGVVVQVETDADPTVVTAIFDALGGRAPANFESLDPQVQQAISAMVDVGAFQPQASLRFGNDAVVCPKCGSHTLRAYDQGANNIKCLTCGNEFHRELLKNPEAKAGKWTVEGMGGRAQGPNARDIMRSEIIRELGLQRISLEQNDMINAAIQRASIEVNKGSTALPHRALQSVTWGAIKDLAVSYMGGTGLEAGDEDVLNMWPDTLPWDEAEQDYYRNARTAAGYGFDGGAAEDFTEFEDGGMDEQEEIRHIQKMVNDGMWGMQGSYGREMMRAIENGLVALGPDPAQDYYGNRIPSRFEVQPGTKGSVEFVNENSPYGVLDPESVDEPGSTTLDDLGVPPEGEDYYRGAKVAAEGKYNAGQRVQIEHQSHKGQRGTIVEYSGKHEDFDEEQYKILLDSGEELENVNESFFKKIKSAKNMRNENLPDSTQEYSLDTMHIAAPGYPLMPGETPQMEDEMLLRGSDPYAGRSAPGDFEDEMDIANCPACDGPGMLLGEMAGRVHYRCRNCGLDFSHKEEPEVPAEVLPPEPPPAPVAPEPQGPPAPGMPGQFMGHTAKWQDSNGQPLSAGAWYRMHHKGYKVPDVVRILNLEDNRIEAAIDTDVKGAFPIIISENHEYSFEPITKEAEWLSDLWLDDDGEFETPFNVPTEIPEWEGEPTEFIPTVGIAPDVIPFSEEEQEYYRSASNWRIARRKFSPAEQRALIEENVDGRARNMDKLDLTGTHYELKEADLDPDFLWGM
jgi:DNA-directed RNA polymerase subunit RPC12/RpoP